MAGGSVGGPCVLAGLSVANGLMAPDRRSVADGLTVAVDLGWRVRYGNGGSAVATSDSLGIWYGNGGKGRWDSNPLGIRCGNGGRGRWNASVVARCVEGLIKGTR